MVQRKHLKGWFYIDEKKEKLSKTRHVGKKEVRAAKEWEGNRLGLRETRDAKICRRVANPSKTFQG